MATPEYSTSSLILTRTRISARCTIWVIGPVLKAVEEYKASIAKYPDPPAANMTKV
jgi:hypothetical protein